LTHVPQLAELAARPPEVVNGKMALVAFKPRAQTKSPWGSETRLFAPVKAAAEVPGLLTVVPVRAY